jgi:hypothetical protein
VPERHEESVELLGGEAAFVEDFLGQIEELSEELRGLSKSERRRQVAALRPLLVWMEGWVSANPLPTAAAAAFAEFKLAVM